MPCYGIYNACGNSYNEGLDRKANKRDGNRIVWVAVWIVNKVCEWSIF